MTKDPVNGEIRRLLTKADDALETESAKIERRLLIAYRKALDDVQAQIARLYESTNTPTLTEMRKFNRLSKIEDQIVVTLRELTKVTVNATHAGVRASFLRSYEDTARALELGTGINLQFDRVPAAAIEYAMSDDLWLDALKQHNGRLLSDVRRELEFTLRQNAREEVASGLAQGKPYSKVAKAIEERFAVTAGRARTITFTEMHKSHSRGRLEGIKRGEKAADLLGIKVYRVWKHNPVGEPRPSHLAADGQRAGEDGLFHVGGEGLEAPGLGRDPANNISCHCNVQVEIEGLEDVKGKAA